MELRTFISEKVYRRATGAHERGGAGERPSGRTVYGFAPCPANPAVPVVNGEPTQRDGHSTSRATDWSEEAMRAHLTTPHGGSARSTQHRGVAIALAIVALLAMALLLVVAAPESAGAAVAGLLPLT